MGTSGTFGGSKTGLVPSWVDEPPSNPTAAPSDGGPAPADGANDGSGDSPVQPTAYPPLPSPPARSGLGAARGDMTRGTRNSDARAIRRGAGRYVAASGGGRGAARRMRSSHATASGLAGLVRNFATQGPTEALRQFNLEGLAGAPAVDVFVALTDALCPPGGTIDEAIARDAMLETVAALAADGVGDFDQMTTEDLHEFFIGVISRSIEGKILNEVGTNSIHLSPDLASVEQAQSMLHDFVDGCVRDRFTGSGASLTDITGDQIDTFIFGLYEAAFNLMQMMGES